jgi:hypothetical protein
MEKWNLHGYNLEADPRQPQRFRWFRLKRQGNFGLGARPDSVQRDGAVKDLPGLGAN